MKNILTDLLTFGISSGSSLNSDFTVSYISLSSEKKEWGPMSTKLSLSFIVFAKPPTAMSFSIIATSYSSWESYQAALRPVIPAPRINTFFFINKLFSSLYNLY